MTKIQLSHADLIRQTGGPVCPPQHILKQTVDRALDGINASNQKSAHRWWFSGALSTAAAVILIIGLNLLPLGQQQGPVAPPPLTASN